MYRLDNLETNNFLNVSFTDICGIYSSFVGSESSLQSNCHGILALCETNLNHLFDYSSFSLEGYNP